MQCPLSRSQLHDVVELLKKECVGYKGVPLDPFLPSGRTVPLPSVNMDAINLAPLEASVKCKFGWNIGDVSLYFTWASFSPKACPSCGAAPPPVRPSVEDLYTCAACMAEIGGKSNRDLVEEIGGGNDEESDAEDLADLGGLGSDGITHDHSTLQSIRFMISVLRSFDWGIPVSHYAMIFRVATSIIHLTLLPGIERDCHHVLLSAALFVGASVVLPAVMYFPKLHRLTGVQWVDVMRVAEKIAVPLGGFFENPERHLTNFMSGLPQDRCLPSDLWYFRRSPEMSAIMDELKQIRQSHPHSLDHTAAIVILELCRANRKAPAVLAAWAEACVQADPSTAAWHSERVLVRFTDLSDHQNSSLNYLLYFFADHFEINALQLCHMLISSDLYRGPTEAAAQLKSNVSCGLYPVPLLLRRGPMESPWESVYRALHSEDGVVLNAVVNAISTAPLGYRHESLADSIVALQAILEKHGSSTEFYANYCLRVDDPTETEFNGDYFCISVSQAAAVYLHFNKMQSLRYSYRTHVVYLNNSKISASVKRHTSQLISTVLPPSSFVLAGPAPKLLLDLASGDKDAQHQWVEACRRINLRHTVCRRIKACRHKNEASRFAAYLSILMTLAPLDQQNEVSFDISKTPSIGKSFKSSVSRSRCPPLAVEVTTSETTLRRKAAAMQHVQESLFRYGGASMNREDYRTSPTARRSASVSTRSPPPLQLPASATIAEPFAFVQLSRASVTRQRVLANAEELGKRHAEWQAGTITDPEEIRVWQEIDADGEASQLSRTQPAPTKA